MDRFSEETNVDPSVACVGLSVWTFRSVTMSQTVNIRAELPPGHLGRHNHTGGCAAVAHPGAKASLFTESFRSPFERAQRLRTRARQPIP